MASYNRVIMVGNLTRDPDYKQQASGQGVCKLSLASNRQFRNKQTGLMVQEVCYIDVDVWGAQAENCRQYLQKGRPVLVEGRLKLDTWESEGQVKRRHSIVADRVVFLGSNGSNQQMDSIGASAEDTIAPATSEQSFKASKPRSAKAKESTSENGLDLNFKDEPPFEEDLPF